VLRKLRALCALSVVALCLVTLTGCTAIARGYIVPEHGQFVLKMIPGCDSAFTHVEVSYVSHPSGLGNGPTETDIIWSVSFRDGAGVPEVTLFTSPANADSEFLVPDIDLSREVLVRWSEPGDIGGVVPGVLGDIEPGFVLWQGGYEDAQEFAGKVSSRTFGC